jgi:hypothetical protein
LRGLVRPKNTNLGNFSLNISIEFILTLRARPQSEKSIVKQTKKQTGIVSYASIAKGTFTLNQNSGGHKSNMPDSNHLQDGITPHNT